MRPALLFLAALAACVTRITSAVAVVGGGFAGHFRGSGAGELRSRQLPGTGPTTELTVSYWLRVDRPGDSAFEHHTGYSAFHWYAYAADSDFEERFLTVSGYDDQYVGVGTTGNMATTFSLADDDGWHHFVYSWQSATGAVQAWMDPGTANEVAFDSATDNDGETMSQGLELPADMWFSLGQGYWAGERAVVGQMDDFAVWNRTLSYAEASALQTQTALTAAPSGLCLNFAFDEDALESVSGEYSALTRDTHDMFALGFGDATFPAAVVSPLELAGAPVLGFVKTDGEDLTVDLACDSCDAVRITSQPATGSLSAVTGTQVVFSGTLAAGASTSFGFSVHDGAEWANGTAVIVGNQAPVAGNQTVAVSETSEGETVFLYWRDIVYDLDHATDLVFEVDELPDSTLLEVYQFTTDVSDDADDYVYFQAGDQITTTPTAVSDFATRVLLVPGAAASGGEALTLAYTVTDPAGESARGFLVIEIVDENFVPEGTDQANDVTEDTSLSIALDAEDPEGDIVYATLTQLPEHGTLYQWEGGEEVSLGTGAELVSQWVASADATTWWPTSDGGNDPFNMEGAADVYPTAADTYNVWQPAESDTFNTVTLEYEEAVFATSVEIYETWSRGSAVAVRVWNNATGEWVTAYEEDGPQIELLNPDPGVFTSFITSLDLCPQPFPTTKIQIDFDIVSLEYWVAIDAVLLWGTAAAPARTVLSDDLSLWYAPDEDYFGADSFAYAVSDCSYFATSRTLREDERTSVVSLTVASVNDAPEVADATVAALDSTPVAIDVPVTDRDGDDDVTAVTLVAGPARGSYSADSGLYTPEQCATPLEPYTVALQFSATDAAGAEAAAPGTVTVEVACAPQVYEVDSAIATVVLAASVLVALYVVAVAAVVFKHRKTKLIRFSTPTFCFGILFFLFLGALGANAMPATPAEDNGVCLVRAWGCAVPLVGAMGALLAKNRRIALLFNNKSLRKMSLSTKDLVKWAACALLVELVLLGVLSAGELTEFELVDGEGSALGFQVEQCTESTPWQLVQLAYVLSMLLFASYSSYRVRNADPEFNEAANIAVTTFVLLFFVVILVPLQWTIDTNPEAVALLRGLGMVFGVATITSILFVPKIFAIYTGTANKSAAASTGTVGTAAGTTTRSAAGPGRGSPGPASAASPPVTSGSAASASSVASGASKAKVYLAPIDSPNSESLRQIPGGAH